MGFLDDMMYELQCMVKPWCITEGTNCIASSRNGASLPLGESPDDMAKKTV